VGAAKPDEESTRMPRVDLGVQSGHSRTVEPVDRDDAAADLDGPSGIHHVGELLQPLELPAGQPDRPVARSASSAVASRKAFPPREAPTRRSAHPLETNRDKLRRSGRRQRHFFAWIDGSAFLT
jgi:hypothetical protein